MAEIQEAEKKLAEFWNKRFKDAKTAKEPYTERWNEYLAAWDNSAYENFNGPDYRSNYVTNYIYSTIESMRPIMFDGNIKFEALPVTKDSLQYCDAINTAFDYEWERTGMKEKMIANSLYTFVTGTSVVMLPYSYDKPGMPVDGDVDPILVNPFNLFPEPLATSVEDAEWIIYANYFHKNILKEQYPEKAEFIEGKEIEYAELVNNRNEGWKSDSQVLVLEVWCRDYTEIESEDEEGNVTKTQKYPKGRVLTIAPDLSLVLDDKENPYDTGRFPFFIFKDMNVPFQFWGEGDVKWLLSPQKAINDLQNQIIDNAKHTANAIWVIDKGAGIARGEITNRPGLIIRKNPGSEVRRDTPPPMPGYVSEQVVRLQDAIENISGVHDVTRGQAPGRIESGNAIQILQEASQTRIRLKISLYEHSLAEMGTEWLARMKQFWKTDRLIPIKKSFSETAPTYGLNGMEMQQNPVQGGMLGAQMQDVMSNPNQMTSLQQFDFVEVGKEQLEQEYRIVVVSNSAMQVNRTAMLETMLNLIKIPAEDGMPMVPREAVLDYIPDVNKQIILDYFAKLKQEQMAMQQQQMMNNQAMQQLQQVSQVTGQLQQRAQKEDQDAERDNYMTQGYQQGISEGMMLNQQTSKQGDINPQLLQQMANMSTDELAQFVQQNPEAMSLLG